ncbi:hypothetical protein EV645_1072 [Kribbella rubisoli]|uniref:Uncharacterized protein n=1 Tax=Kribbella rubisoli TaxID=3075929 RepID=A0A4Q7X733_9ACTN|nr:hypothetical protein [Kribbella rubisoli]RZU18872.1 hypothetical protein EV645_1072 [Kribbella rubisoli]
MNWGEVRNGRLLAGLYLAAFTMVVAGVIWILILQWSGSDATIVAATILFLAGGLTIIALAVGLRARAAPPKNRLTKDTTGYQRLYHRFALGLELPGAWRAVRG